MNALPRTGEETSITAIRSMIRFGFLKIRAPLCVNARIDARRVRKFSIPRKLSPFKGQKLRAAFQEGWRGGDKLGGGRVTVPGRAGKSTVCVGRQSVDVLPRAGEASML